MSEMCHMTNSPVRQGAPEAERREKGGQLENDRQMPDYGVWMLLS